MVKIGGVNVKDIPKEELMNTVSFVFQNSRLIKASILENVRMGKPEAAREEVLTALHHAQCDDILEKLPQGVDCLLYTSTRSIFIFKKQRDFAIKTKSLILLYIFQFT